MPKKFWSSNKSNESDSELNNHGSTYAIEDNFLGQPKIVIVGCCGAGNNIVNHIHNLGISDAETIAIDTDRQHLDMIQADKRVLIGKSINKGLGTEGNLDTGKRSAEMARPALEDLLDSADLVFVIVGLGGGAGTGSASVIAQVAREQGAIVVGIVSYPLQNEIGRISIADVGMKSLISSSDSVIVLDNNHLMDPDTDMPINRVFSLMNQIIGEAVKGILELITEPMLISIDYADIRAIMSKGGISVMFVGENKQQNRVDSVVRECLSNPTIKIDYRGATGCLIHISGGWDMSLKEAEEIASLFTNQLDPHADVIWGVRVRNDMEGTIRVFAIMTGVKSHFDKAQAGEIG